MTDFNLDEHLDSLMKQLPKSTHVEKKDLLKLRNGLLEGRYWTEVRAVARSGMSRTIGAYIQYPMDDGGTWFGSIHPDILKTFAGVGKNGRISGCGMDMLFKVQYDLFSSLCPDRQYQEEMPRYNSLP